jgi:hypothetical protein
MGPDPDHEELFALRFRDEAPLAQAVYGESTLDDDQVVMVGEAAPQEPAPSVAVDRASLLED